MSRTQDLRAAQKTGQEIVTEGNFQPVQYWPRNPSDPRPWRSTADHSRYASTAVFARLPEVVPGTRVIHVVHGTRGVVRPGAPRMAGNVFVEFDKMPGQIMAVGRSMLRRSLTRGVRA